MNNEKINPIVYVTCGSIVTIGMVTIKLIGWLLYKVSMVFLFH